MEEYTVKVYSNKTEWRQGDKLHRIDGPAIEWANGTKSWYQNGEYHRLDGPAIEGPDGYKEYYIEGKRHRIDGPAIEGPDGYKEYYLHGKEVTESEVMTPSESCEGKIVEVDGVKYVLKEM